MAALNVRFALAPGMDIEGYAARLRLTGHVRISPFLAGDAAALLHAHLCQRTDWLQMINSGAKLFELDRPTRAGMSEAKLRALDNAVWRGAEEGFQHRYEAIRIRDGNEMTGREALLDRFVAWLSEGQCRDMLRAITGKPDIGFADGQATAYSQGDFLTGHDDGVTGKRRQAAYVFGLTPLWRVEWGGLLLFHGTDGRVEGAMPGFNTLDLFLVPQMHSVSAVVPAAACRRLAITGWLRTPPSDLIT